jgi:hypothetical protein
MNVLNEFRSLFSYQRKHGGRRIGIDHNVWSKIVNASFERQRHKKRG